ncbi:hypothetical protein [Pseudomonas shirazensis]|uniref:hypothetical protein n=1 Tax=Pseudomonas shirazensis TaxID=2745494 RepID=UPI0039883524
MWLQALPEADRRTSDDFFALLGELTGTSDYRLTQADLARRVWAVLFSEVEAPYWARLDQLSPQLHRREGRYLEQVNDLAKERRAAIDALALRLSKRHWKKSAGTEQLARLGRQRFPLPLCMCLGATWRLFYKGLHNASETARTRRQHDVTSGQCHR